MKKRGISLNDVFFNQYVKCIMISKKIDKQALVGLNLKYMYSFFFH